MHGVMSLLRCRKSARNPSRALYKPSIESLVHERMAYEALLFHGVNLMLFNRSFSMFDQPWWDSMEEYFHSAPLPTTFDEESWPILGMPFDVFRLAIAAHSLSRRYPLSNDDSELAMHSISQLDFFRRQIPCLGSFSAGYTYLVATTALLRYILIHSKNEVQLPKEVYELPATDISKIKANIEAGRFFAHFPLWPLAGLYGVSENDVETETLKKLIEDALRDVNGPASKPPSRRAVGLFMMAPGLLRK